MKIVVACGSGVATSTVIAERVERLAKENGFKVRIAQCSMNEVESEAKDAVLVVTSLGRLKVSVKVPIVVAFSYITGVGGDITDAKILEILRSAEQ